MAHKEAFLLSTLTTPQERTLAVAVAQAVDDPTALVYADWIEEHHGPEAPERSEFLRIRHKLRTGNGITSLELRLTELRDTLSPAWLSLIGDTAERLRSLWEGLVADILATDEYADAEALPTALQVSSDEGLLDVRYDCYPTGDWDGQVLRWMIGREVAPVLHELRLVGNGSAANGVRDVRIDALLEGCELTNLQVFEIERACEDGSPWIGGLDGEQGALGRFLAKAPMLRVLISPSAPDETFFEVGERSIEELHVVAGMRHQGFIRNLADSTCFPKLRVLDWTDAVHTYMDGWSQYCTPMTDYLALFRSPVMERLERVVLSNVYVTESEQKELLNIRRKGVEINRLTGPFYSQP
jgi:uncharacterized protein (TIGR02996 family)